MSIRRLIFFLLVAVAFLLATGMPTTSSDLIVGRNVNMVSGTDFIGGDPYLQRQNEPSIAVSTRNPLHLLAGANDYRTIDIPFPDELPGIPEGTAARDAWVGVFKSIDGGESWTSTLLPGYPQDPEGTISPIYGYDAACDPVVRAGTNGLFYYSGIAFNREERGAGVVFVARFIDNNNIEAPETIEYIDTNIVDQGNAGQFLDMPSIAVDLPRGLTTTGRINTAGNSPQDIPCGNVYITYSVFLGNTIENVRSRILFTRSTDCGLTWTKPIKLSESQHIIQRPKVAIDPSDPTGGTVYVAFRRFAHGKEPDAIVIVKSSDGGQTFTKPIEVASINPFDQGTSIYSFRTNGYPTLTVDNNGIVYLAWSQRVGPLPQEEARIMLTTSTDGQNWPDDPWVVDNSGIGHQFMPSLTCVGGKLMMAWYDQRNDIAIETNSSYFTKYIEDSICRHTIDVRVAQAEPGPYPAFGPAKRVTRYLYLLKTDEDGKPIIGPGGYLVVKQVQFNPPNYPLFQMGTVPFHGDYMEIASLMFLPTQSGGWVYNTDSSQASVFHTTWTDNRDVVPPNGNWWGNWANYDSWPFYNRPHNDFDPDACANEQNTGMRNQNVYTSAITEGLIVGSPGNSKQLDLERTFVVFVKNTTGEERSFRMALVEDAGVSASFKQFEDLEELDVTISPYSTISRTVYVNSLDLRASVMVNVNEIDAPGGDIIGGLEGYVVLNPDQTNPDALDPNAEPLYYEVHNPRVENPRVENYNVVSELNTNLLSPRVENADLINPGYISPRVENPRVENPRVENLNIVNPRVENPRVENPRVENTALTDVVWTVANEGNTTSAYTFTLLSEEADEEGDFPGGLIEQVLIYKIHTTPIASAENGCDLVEVHHDELVTVISNPRVENPRVENPRVENPRVENPRVENATVNLAPGEEALFVLRIYDPIADDEYTIEDAVGTEENPKIGNATTAHAVDTEDVMEGDTTPTVSYSANYSPAIGYSPSSLAFTAFAEGSNPASKILQIQNTANGTLFYTITDNQTWLDVSPTEGTSIAGDPPNDHTVSVDISELSEGTYDAEITIIGYGASNTHQTVPVTLTISPAVTISGQVTLGGLGLQGVTMSGLPGTPTPTTDASGNYSGTVNSGWSGTVTPTLAGHYFTPSSQPYTDVTSNQVTNYTAALKTYTLTYTAGAGGSIMGATSQTVDHGSDGTAVTAVPSTNYHFVQWSDSSTDNPRTDTNVTAGISVTASFAIDQYTVTFVEGAGGNITGTLVQTVNHGADCSTVTAVPDTGYSFISWTGDYTGSTNPLTITNVTSDMTITANFALNIVAIGTDTDSVNVSEGGTATFQVNLSAEPASSVTVTVSRTAGDTDISVTGGGTLTFTTSNWGDYQTVTLSAAEDNTDTASGSATITCSSASATDKSVTANEVDDDITLTVNNDGNGSTTPSEANIIDTEAMPYAISATANTGYHFFNWSGTGIDNVNSASTTITTAVDATITANFAIDQYTLTVNIVGSGSVTKDPVQATYTYGTGVDLTATADPGWTFANWSGDLTGSTNPETIVMNGNKTVTAEFTQIEYTVGVTISPPEAEAAGCSVTGAGIYHFGDTVELDAVQTAGWSFSGWSGYLDSQDDPVSFTMPAENVSLTATFAINTYTISGTVTFGGNTIQGVTVTFSHDSHTEITNEIGYYEYMVNHGTNTTITASHPGYSGWTPITLTNIVSDQPGQDFVGAVINTYKISGTVSDGANPIEGVTVTFSHDGHTESTNASGNYEYMVNYDTTTTLTASHPGYSGWIPDEITLTNIASDQPNKDFVGTINQYTITASAGSGGSITPSGEVIVQHGADQLFTIEPDPEFEISEVRVNGTPEIPIPTEYTFYDVTDNQSIAADFSALVSGIVTTDLTTPLTATDLANLLLGEGVTISNPNYSGDNLAAGTFTGGSGIIGFESGIMLSSGKISDVVGPNSLDNTQTNFTTPGDPTLDTISGGTTEDAAVLEFDFMPDNNGVVTFRYVFTSEEYNEYANGAYNDVFGFFIDGVNRALLPDGITPVSINTVNGGNPFGTNAKNPEYFRNNDPNDPGPALIDIEADGLTVVLTLTSSVNVNQLYHIKLAIADVGDGVYDSWVFIESGSFEVSVPSDGQTIAETVTLTEDIGPYGLETTELQENAETPIEKTKEVYITLMGRIRRSF